MNFEDCILIGKITKTTGFKGELILQFNTSVSKKSFSEKFVFLNLNNRLVPFFIKNIRIINNSASVLLEGIESEKKASEYLKTEIYLQKISLVLLSKDTNDKDVLIGFQLNDVKLGNIGTVTEILDFPQQKILQILHPNGKEILLPFIEKFILKRNSKEKILEIEAPEGLIEMYLNPNSEKQN